MSSTGRTRRSYAERRQELIEAAGDMARELGLDRVTVRDVAQAAGVTPGLIHHYFPSIDELLGIVFHDVVVADLERMHDGLDALPAAEALHELVERMCAAERQEVLTVWMSGWMAASRRVGLRDGVNALMDRGVALLGQLIERGVVEGAFSCADPPASALRIMTVADGALVQRAIDAETAASAGLVEFLHVTAEREVRAAR